VTGRILGLFVSAHREEKYQNDWGRMGIKCEFSFVFSASFEEIKSA